MGGREEGRGGRCHQVVEEERGALCPLGDLHGGGRKFKGASCCSGPYGARQAWGGVFRVPRLGSHRWCNTVFHHNDPRPSKNPRR